MNPQEELNQLLKLQEALHQELKARKKELLEAQRTPAKDNSSNARSAAPRSRITAAQRKRRTRRLILIGTVVLAQGTTINPNTEYWLKQALKESPGSPPGTR